jgi:uncharacterized protein YkwD
MPTAVVALVRGITDWRGGAAYVAPMRESVVVRPRPFRGHLHHVVVLAGARAAMACGGEAAGPDPSADPLVASFAEQVNAHRGSVGCPQLVWNPAVAAVAQEHSADMVDRDFFSHTNPDGASPFDRLTEAGIVYSGAAENIAYGYATAEAVLAAWLGSPGHRANIENCALTEHGVGLDGTHWTHLFIRP